MNNSEYSYQLSYPHIFRLYTRISDALPEDSYIILENKDITFYISKLYHTCLFHYSTRYLPTREIKLDESTYDCELEHLITLTANNIKSLFDEEHDMYQYAESLLICLDELECCCDDEEDDDYYQDNENTIIFKLDDFTCPSTQQSTNCCGDISNCPYLQSMNCSDKISNCPYLQSMKCSDEIPSCSEQEGEIIDSEKFYEESVRREDNMEKFIEMINPILPKKYRYDFLKDKEKRLNIYKQLWELYNGRNVDDISYFEIIMDAIPIFKKHIFNEKVESPVTKNTESTNIEKSEEDKPVSHDPFSEYNDEVKNETPEVVKCIKFNFSDSSSIDEIKNKAIDKLSQKSNIPKEKAEKIVNSFINRDKKAAPELIKFVFESMKENIDEKDKPCYELFESLGSNISDIFTNENPNESIVNILNTFFNKVLLIRCS